jgi:hypothetical protein
VLTVRSIGEQAWCTTPLTASHVSSVHALPSSIGTGVPGWQVPDAQVSLVVHALLALQDVPSAATGFEQVPVVELHVPTVWHASLAVHVTGLEPVHAPLWHAYAWLHLSVPVHAVPLVAAGLEH